jgi:hypothetical protein
MIDGAKAFGAVALLGLLASVACRSGRRPESPAIDPLTNCEGRLYLEVTNSLKESIDVYVGDPFTAQTAARTFLGTARPGTTRLAIEDWQRTPPSFAASGGMPIDYHAVRYAYRCEQP